MPKRNSRSTAAKNTPPAEPVKVQYHSRNMEKRLIKSARVLVALDKYPSVEACVNAAIDKGLDVLYAEHQLVRVA